MSKQRSTKRRRLLRVLATLLALGIVFLAWVAVGLPSRDEVRALANEPPGETALMLERQREAGAAGETGPPRHTWVPLSRISRHLLHAVIASEDQRFLSHGGVDWTAVRESMEDNVERRRLWRGGSTLTQQLAKNLFFGTSRTPARKTRELVVTSWLEAELTKARILTLYLNVVEWGDGIYGCEAASRHWLGKPAAELTVEDAAALAAMLPNPRRINPAANPRWFERARRRVLGLMEASAYIGRDLAGLGADPPSAPAAPVSLPAPEPVPAAVPGLPG